MGGEMLGGSTAAEPSEPAAGRVALVTDGNRGLGLRIVRALAERGLRVVLASRSVEHGRVAVELLGDLANRVAVRQLNIEDPASIARLALWLRQWLERCDVLVNNLVVPLADDRSLATRADLNVVRRTLEANLLGTWRLTQAIVPLMRGHRYGRIVNVAGVPTGVGAVRRSLPAYRASARALVSLTRILAAELAEHGTSSTLAAPSTRRPPTRRCSWRPCPTAVPPAAATGTRRRPAGETGARRAVSRFT
jgi:NAD(P)-dependent dehydrogenase (short-subunit alcohol dehydrogenase family)